MMAVVVAVVVVGGGWCTTAISEAQTRDTLVSISYVPDEATVTIADTDTAADIHALEADDARLLHALCPPIEVNWGVVVHLIAVSSHHHQHRHGECH